jgi:alkylhydroperoxidase/carboxymuconolactone decarboxylase family protein YurZ
MADTKQRVEQLKAKYGEKAIDSAARLNPEDFPELLDWRDELDQNYTKLWLDWTYGGMWKRGVLADRVRMLVVIGQCIGMNELDALPAHIRSALACDAAPREILEVILQLNVYIGHQRVDRAARIFHAEIRKAGRLGEITKTQLPIEGRNAERTLEEDRKTWNVSEKAFPQREALVAKYGWHGIGSGLRLQPTHHPQTLTLLDQIDQNFCKLWLDWVYGGMYTRQVLDDKTRELVVIGELIVLGEAVQIQNHIRAALMLGVPPRHVLEVVLQSSLWLGMPSMTRNIRLLLGILEEEKRMDEVTKTQLPLPF